MAHDRDRHETGPHLGESAQVQRSPGRRTLTAGLVQAKSKATPAPHPTARRCRRAFALVKKKVGDTVYGIGWLPLGGYVKISGMIDESMDKEAMKQPPQEWEFRSKPAWQRLIVMLGGVIMNVLVAFVIYAFILMIWGDKKIPAASMKYGVHVVDSTMYKMGIRNGDKILEIDGQEVKDYDKLRRSLLLGTSVTVDRNGQKVNLTLDGDLIGQLVENRNKEASGFVEVRKPAIAFFVPDTSNAFKAGLRKDDMLVAVDSVRFDFYDELQNQLTPKKNKTIQLTVVRSGQEMSFPVAVSGEGKIGFAPYGYSYDQMDSLGWVKLNVIKYGFRRRRRLRRSRGPGRLPQGRGRGFPTLPRHHSEGRAGGQAQAEGADGGGGHQGAFHGHSSLRGISPRRSARR